MDKKEFIIIAYEPSRVRTFDNYELPGGKVVCVEMHRFLVEYEDGFRTHRKIPFRVHCEEDIAKLNQHDESSHDNFLDIQGKEIY